MHSEEAHIINISKLGNLNDLTFFLSLYRLNFKESIILILVLVYNVVEALIDPFLVTKAIDWHIESVLIFKAELLHHTHELKSVLIESLVCSVYFRIELVCDSAYFVDQAFVQRFTNHFIHFVAIASIDANILDMFLQCLQLNSHLIISIVSSVNDVELHAELPLDLSLIHI